MVNINSKQNKIIEIGIRMEKNFTRGALWIEKLIKEMYASVPKITLGNCHAGQF